MFTYCRNNPINFSDKGGMKFSSSRDIDGDGNEDLFIYSYEFPLPYIYAPGEKGIGYVFFYTGISMNFFDSSDNYPAEFVSQRDLLVADLTDQENPTLFAYQAQKIPSNRRRYIINTFLEYDLDRDTPWKRTAKSLLVEWKQHALYSPFDKSAQDIDFDNAEEGKGARYYIKKAITRVIEKFRYKSKVG